MSRTFKLRLPMLVLALVAFALLPPIRSRSALSQPPAADGELDTFLAKIGPIPLRPEGEIIRIEAEIHNGPSLIGELPRVPRFTVPEELHDELMAYFSQPCPLPRASWDRPQLGALYVVFRSDGVDSVRTYVLFKSLGKRPLMFSCWGVQCHDGRNIDWGRDWSMVFDGILRQAFEDSTGLNASQIIDNSGR